MKGKKFIALLLSITMLASLSIGSFADTELTIGESTTKEMTDNSEPIDKFFAVERPFNFDEDTDRDSELAQKLLDEYKTVWFFDGNAYSLRNKQVLVKTNLQTGEEEELYRDDDGIDMMYLEPEMAYIKKGTSLYRFHLPTQILEKVFTDEGFNWFRPISNIKVEVHILTPQYVKYVQETGDKENLHGIPMVNQYELNVNTGEMVEIKGMLGNPERVSISPRITYMGDYPAGSYFTKNGKACNAPGGNDCHSHRYCDWDPSNPNYDSCNCKPYRNAIQCMGYAKYLYAENHKGANWGAAQYLYFDSTTSEGRAEAAKMLKNFFAKEIGVKHSNFHLRINNDNHSVIYTTWETDGINVVEANNPAGTCQVRKNFYTYEQLVSSGTYIYYNL